MSTITPPPSAVIDTQVVMDWLVFREASISPLIHAIECGQVRWVGHPAMLAELLHVLGRGVAADRLPNLEYIKTQVAQYCVQIEAMPPPTLRLLCRDPDDQIFIDLAIQQQTRWLISRDRAVLALAKRARAFGLGIVTPQVWIKAAL